MIVHRTGDAVRSAESRPQTDTVTIDEVGGYRLVRRLGESARAVTYVGHPNSRPEKTVVVKTFVRGVGGEDVAREVAAVTRAAGEHVVDLLDVVTEDDGGRALVFEHLPGGTLGRLLRQRGSLGVGEAITVLAPLVAAVSRLADNGVAHHDLRLETVVFDGRGSPTVTGFGSATLLASGHPPVAMDVAGEQDRRALADIVATVLDGVPPSPAARALSAWLEAGVGDARWTAELGARLFELGEPLPVAFTRPTTTDAAPAGAGMDSPLPERPEALAAFLLPPWLEQQIERLGPAARCVRGVLTSARAVRRRVWVPAAIVAAGIIGVAVVTAVGRDAPVERADLVPAAIATSAPPGAASPTVAAGAPAPDDIPETDASDPLVALHALAQIRQGCLEALSVDCLDGVVHDGSPAGDQDRDAVRAAAGGGGVPAGWSWTAADAVVLEEFGGTVLVGITRNGEPASVLMTRTEAGWRIRDYPGAPVG